MIILDTNVVSELMRATPEPAVVEWVSGHAPSTLHTTSITAAEILLGIELMPAGKKREALRAAAERIFSDVFAERVLSFGNSAAAAFASIVASRRRAGRPIADLDAQIAAISSTEKASLATRNQGDFEGCGVKVVNPWSG